jgi:hypothetical protein
MRDGEKCPQGKEPHSLLKIRHLPGNNELLILTRLLPQITSLEPLPKPGLR